MFKLDKLDLGITSFLQVKIRAIVDCLYYNLFTPLTGKKDERKFRI